MPKCRYINFDTRHPTRNHNRRCTFSRARPPAAACRSRNQKYRGSADRGRRIAPGWSAHDAVSALRPRAVGASGRALHCAGPVATRGTSVTTVRALRAHPPRGGAHLPAAAERAVPRAAAALARHHNPRASPRPRRAAPLRQSAQARAEKKAKKEAGTVGKKKAMIQGEESRPEWGLEVPRVGAASSSGTSDGCCCGAPRRTDAAPPPPRGPRAARRPTATTARARRPPPASLT